MIVDDLCRLSWAFHDGQTELIGQPAVLNPTFVGTSDVDGADADLIVGGCLVDIKATVNAVPLKPLDLSQVVGYALLDYDDEDAIESVGIYLARQAVLVRWPLADLVSVLTGGQVVCRGSAARAEDGAGTWLAPARRTGAAAPTVATGYRSDDRLVPLEVTGGPLARGQVVQRGTEGAAITDNKSGIVHGPTSLGAVATLLLLAPSAAEPQDSHMKLNAEWRAVVRFAVRGARFDGSLTISDLPELEAFQERVGLPLGFETRPVKFPGELVENV